MKSIAIYILCLMYSTATLAAAVNETGGTSIAPTVNPSKVNLYGGTSIAPGVAPPAPTPQSTINQGANTGKQAEDGGSGANNAAGAALIAAGTPMLAQPPTMPMGMMLIAMGILALMQGGHDSGASDQSANTAGITTSTGGTTGTGGTASESATPTDGGIKAAFNTPAGAKALAAITGAGGSITADKLTLPDGTSIPMSSLSSPSAMSAAGLDGKAAAKILADVEKKLAAQGIVGASGMALAEGSGGGGVANMFGKEGSTFKMPKFNSPFDLSADDKSKLAAGKTIRMGGDPIGVAGDDLFAMVHRAYVRKDATDEFVTNGYKGDTPSVSIRAPASVIRKGK